VKEVNVCISYSVGQCGRNELADVAAVQTLLNLNLSRLKDPKLKPLSVDGRIGTNTMDRIAAFETRVMGLPESDRLVAPGDATIAALIRGLQPGPTVEKLNIALPLALPTKVDLYFTPLKGSLIQHGITSDLQVAHFIAQIGHESASFLYSEEIASGAAYEGRKDLGNTKKGDGVRYKGRGLIQITGRANYTAYSDYAGKDYVSQPELLAQDPAVAVDSACWFWISRKIGPLADADDVKAVTKRINGGFNGLDDRIQNLKRVKALLGI
jgi:putative chitinase